MKIGISGLGFVGNSMFKSFELKGLVKDKSLFGYDKFKNDGIGDLNNLLNCNIIFMALPTLYDDKLCMYDKSAIEENLLFLQKNNYLGIIVIKSTVEPETTNKLSIKYNLKIIHNPEFLTARTAFDDFHNQKHIVLGKGIVSTFEDVNTVKNFYEKYYPDADISISSSLESESMKSFCNSFYSVKVQFFTELYCLCQKNGCDYNKVKNMMLKNNWINEMHTIIPGPDGMISYGGACFPKDTNALNKYMVSLDSPNKVIEACIEERNSMRND